MPHLPLIWSNTYCRPYQKYKSDESLRMCRNLSHLVVSGWNALYITGVLWVLWIMLTHEYANSARYNHMVSDGWFVKTLARQSAAQLKCQVKPRVLLKTIILTSFEFIYNHMTMMSIWFHALAMIVTITTIIILELLFSLVIIVTSLELIWKSGTRNCELRISGS